MRDGAPAPDLEPSRLTRRKLIQGSLAAGATAWVAPVIVDSFASPAAAATGLTGCYRLLYPITFFSAPCSPVAPATGCCQPVGYSTASPGTNFATVAAGCIVSATGCGNVGETGTFVLSDDCNCQFVAGTVFPFTDNCVLGVLSNNNKTITFADTPCTDPGASGYRLLISCGGATSCVGGVTDTCEGCGTV